VVSPKNASYTRPARSSGSKKMPADEFAAFIEASFAAAGIKPEDADSGGEFRRTLEGNHTYDGSGWRTRLGFRCAQAAVAAPRSTN